MGEIVSFIKDMFMCGSAEAEPIGLCGFEHSKKQKKKAVSRKPQPKREMRLSELME